MRQWKAIEVNYNIYLIENEKGLIVCNNIYGDVDWSAEEYAKLIAVAPEMLELIADIYQELKNDSNYSFISDLLKKMIEKATDKHIIELKRKENE